MLRTARRRIAEAAVDLEALTPGRSGNLSLRRDERIAITPTGIPYSELTADDVSVVSLAGEHHAGAEPSSETPMHRAIYRARDAGSIAHTHSPWATTLAALRESLPPIHYDLARVGGSVPVAEYATYGTEALAENAVAALESADTSACLLANHGLVVTGSNVGEALENTRAVEFTARVLSGQIDRRSTRAVRRGTRPRRKQVRELRAGWTRHRVPVVTYFN